MLPRRVFEKSRRFILSKVPATAGPRKGLLSSRPKMRSFIKNNVKLSGREEGKAMVFAHGFGCDQNMWRFVAPAFEDEYRIVLFDHVGAGGSDLSAYNPALLES